VPMQAIGAMSWRQDRHAQGRLERGSSGMEQLFGHCWPKRIGLRVTKHGTPRSFRPMSIARHRDSRPAGPLWCIALSSNDADAPFAGDRALALEVEAAGIEKAYISLRLRQPLAGLGTAYAGRQACRVCCRVGRRARGCVIVVGLYPDGNRGTL